MTIITDRASIVKAIASIASRGKKLDDSIQQTGLSVLAHIEEHGNVELASKLYDALPKGARRLALAEWMLAHGKLRPLNPKAKDDQPALKAGLHFGYDRAKETNLEAAAAKPWHEFKQEKSVSDAFNVQDKALRMVLEAAKNGVTLEDMLAAVQAAYATEKAQKALQAAKPSLPDAVLQARAAVEAE